MPRFCSVVFVVFAGLKELLTEKAGIGAQEVWYRGSSRRQPHLFNSQKVALLSWLAQFVQRINAPVRVLFTPSPILDPISVGVLCCAVHSAWLFFFPQHGREVLGKIIA